MRQNMYTRRAPAVTAVAVLSVVLSLLLGACGRDQESRVRQQESAESALRAEQPLRLVYPRWSSEIASAHLFQAVLQERLRYPVQLIAVPVEEMWRRVAEGEADVMTGAWLPTTHQGYYQEYADRLEDLGPNLRGARIGLVVPTVTPGRQTGDTGQTGKPLVTISSIAQMGETAGRFRGRIVGIESGSGVVARTRKALEVYDLEGSFYLVETDEEGMMDRVAEAINRGEWVVFTGWKPHWVFEHFNLRFLKDPRNVYGGEEAIHTMVRSGLAEEMPEIHEALSRISYNPEELERLMRWIHSNGDTPYEQAVRWIEVHEDKADSWVEGIE